MRGELIEHEGKYFVRVLSIPHIGKCYVPHRFDDDYAVVLIDDSEGILCRACGLISFSPRDVEERYCGNCQKWHRGPKRVHPVPQPTCCCESGPRVVGGKVSITPLELSTEGDGISFPGTPHEETIDGLLGLEGNTIERAMVDMGKRHGRIAPTDYVGPPGTYDLALLAAIARHFEIESFPDGTQVHFDGGAHEEQRPCFTITGPLQRVVNKKGDLLVDPKAPSAGDGDWFQMTILVSRKLADAIHTASYDIDAEISAREYDDDPAGEHAIDVNYRTRGGTDTPMTVWQEMRQGSFARDVQRQLKGPTH